jgi:hypothetical protein
LSRRRGQLASQDKYIELTKSQFERVVSTDEPQTSPSEQVDALILLIGDKQRTAGRWVPIDASESSALIGAPIDRDEFTIETGLMEKNGALNWLFEQPTVIELIQVVTKDEAKKAFSIQLNTAGQKKADFYMRLTMLGWSRYDELTRRRIDSKKVLMAMKFGDEELEKVFKQCFAAAVERTGFHLRRAIDDQPAGLIDDQLRVALRTSRFVIADLTHQNNGAYWEAGFAEGLGRPVIYTCKESVWKSKSSHFDTNHLTTLLWSPKREQFEEVASKLAATIRATLPDVATLEG